MTGARDLEELQLRTFAGTTVATQWAYPVERRLPGQQLAEYLDRRSLAVVSSTRPDGRPHSALTTYIRRGTTFWLPTTADSVRERNLRSQPWLVLVVAQGDGGDHIAVIVEGTAEVTAPAAVPDDVTAAFPRPWIAAWIRLEASRVLSYTD
jgi:predicted pyridoxine 5'-phosphate oxidase superfamily flavin-nucleotide-binding protein